MSKIEPLDYDELNRKMTGLRFEDALKIFVMEIMEKMNEVVEFVNNKS